MRLRSITYIVLAIAVIAGFTACNQEVSFVESQAIDKEGWMLNDTVTLSPSIEAADGTYDVYMWVRHSKNYDYSNIWLKVMSDPMLTKDSSYMLEIPIADKTGRWLGHCTQSLCTARVQLKSNYRFENAAAFKVDVLQYMREENLKAVRDVGLEIMPALAE